MYNAYVPLQMVALCDKAKQATITATTTTTTTTITTTTTTTKCSATFNSELSSCVLRIMYFALGCASNQSIGNEEYKNTNRRKYM